EVIALGSPLELKRKVMGGDVVEVVFDSLSDEVLSALQSADFVLELKMSENTLTLVVKSGAEAVPRIVELANNEGGKFHSVTLRAPTLDDVFLQFTGRSIREDTAVIRKRFVSTWERMRR
ncbi:DUF4162 domain-containing protein, partial [Candidatus Bathyarchaeota archaeon]|nr:DUF4162 domain-containing protein [Candidatus Bathyarchaeota archaeon]